MANFLDLESSRFELRLDIHMALLADSTLYGHPFQYFVDSSPLHLDTQLLRLSAMTRHSLHGHNGANSGPSSI